MTQSEKDDFVQWHNARMVECGYPRQIVEELIATREKWLASVPTVKATANEAD